MSPPPQRPSNPARIFLLPNLMTAGNLIFGFLAILKILEGSIQRETGGSDWTHYYFISIYCILAACVFDLLDGRLARLGGKESPFGREFDSLADVVSFGVAPALLVFKIVLYEIPHQIGWLIAGFYLLCGALRLARFNVAAAYNLDSGTRNFTGFPIPAAAGLISSITLLIISNYQNEAQLSAGYAGIGLAALMVFLAFMMFSKFEYPSFKGFNWRTQFSLPKFLGAVALLLLNIIYCSWMPAVMFVAYLLYGFLRPFISRAWRREIEEDEEDESPAPPSPDDG
ncbi:MAG TPA: CDP-diacylglycerol--serine O-phosphatidyltransferase [Candidatus Methylacidiphilales bacterium]|jgi:CDP-diacylglycerol--serine O-phosphatidyltransferase|nr:CDP-diacylglycerol--serine O-phosphatidyltransferase [Candidatus Methylacidiphilales bacterium]